MAAEAVNVTGRTRHQRHEAAAAAGRRRRGGRGRRRRDAVVRGTHLQPAVFQSRGRRRRADHAGARQRAAFPTSSRTAAASISVPAEQLAAARLKLAAQGLPEGGGGVNAMTKDPGFGVSAFMENARYQHALETELARTIASAAERAGRARAPGHGAAVRVRQRSPAGLARRCSCRSRPAAVSTTSRCRPSPTSWPPAFRS